MLTWVKNILGITPKREALVLTEEQKITETTSPKAQKTAAKSKKKAQKNVDLTVMSKKELLAEAKSRGVPANASLKKEVILERLKSA
jgi:hypothetical protein